MGEELGIPDVAKTVAWAGDSLCVGFKRDYYLIKVSVMLLLYCTLFLLLYSKLVVFIFVHFFELLVRVIQHEENHIFKNFFIPVVLDHNRSA